MTKSRQVADFGAGGFTAGKNKIINGDFSINQRNFTTTSDLSGTNVYTVDRLAMNSYLGAQTTTVQTFTTGTSPSGYELTNYLRTVTTSQSTSGYCIATQKIEDVRTFAGQTVTFSFLAKAASGTPKVAFYLRQNFGTGGSPSSSVDTLGGTVTLSTSWARYSITVAIPSISGKTIGTTVNTSCLEMNAVFSSGTYSFGQSIGAQNNTFEHTAWQLEQGSVATPFTTATGTIQGELAACQRYYWRRTGTQYLGTGSANSATQGDFIIQFPVEMRTAPTMATNSGTAYFKAFMGNTDTTATTIGNFFTTGTLTVNGRITGSGLTTGYATVGFINNASAYLEASSEL
jgi:hypothetical protein